MRKIFQILSIVLIVTACHKEPDMSDLENRFVVFTNYDKEVDFTSFNTYFIPDSVLIIGGGPQPRYWALGQTERVVSLIEDNMNQRGYTRTLNKDEADLGLQVSYIEDVSYFGGGYYDYPYWWWDYPGYWGPGYWGSWGGWYYPYPIVYSYHVGSLLAEMVNLKSRVPRDAESRLEVVWTSYMSGLLSGSNEFDMNLAIQALEQAFNQSPYIRK